MSSISKSVKWLIGCAAFAAPVLIAALGRRLDHSAYRHAAIYKSLVPVFAVGSLAVAVLVPAMLLLTSVLPVWRRVGYLIGVWSLLCIELYWLFFTVVVAP